MIVDGQDNIGHSWTQQQLIKDLGDMVVFRWLAASGATIDITFAELDHQSIHFARDLTILGFSPGEIFFTFLPIVPEQFFLFLGSLKRHAIGIAWFCKEKSTTPGSDGNRCHHDY